MTFAEQCRNLHCDTVVVPGPLVSQLAAAGYLSGPDDLKSVVAAWRAPEQLRRAPDWGDTAPALIDVQLFGEIGLIAARRGPNGRPAPIPLGPLLASRDADGVLTAIEVAASPNGTLALRGPMVPASAFPPGAERTSFPRFTAAADGFVDTSYAVEVGRDTDTMVVSGPPPGLVSFGGYRFAVGELTNIINGHRLAGTATNHEAIRMALRGIGANPLLVEAFGRATQDRSQDGRRMTGGIEHFPEKPAAPTR
jgi:hypothetical protein